MTYPEIDPPDFFIESTRGLVGFGRYVGDKFFGAMLADIADDTEDDTTE